MSNSKSSEIRQCGNVIFRETSDAKDSQRQKCRISVCIAEQWGLSLGQYVRIRMPSKTVICRAFPTIESEACVYYNSLVTESCDQLLQARESQIVDIEYLDCHTAKEICVKVIAKDASRYRTAPDLGGIHSELCTQCVFCMYGVCVTSGCSVNLTRSRLAKFYGITHCMVLSASSEAGPANSQSAMRITQATVIRVSEVQSLECHQLLVQPPGRRVGGLQEESTQLANLLSLPHHLSRSQGVLLHGPPGCGKTSLVRQVAFECGAALMVVNTTDILSSDPGESEKNIAAVFDKAVRLSQEVPFILFIDEVDAICPKEGNSNSIRVSVALLAQMDKITGRSGLLAVMATNSPAALDPALRRPGRLDTEILLSVPSRSQRREILDIVLHDVPLGDDFDLDWLSSVTSGFVGADLELLCQEAWRKALYCLWVQGLQPQDLKCKMRRDDVERALLTVKPSLQRGMDSVVDMRSVPWSSIGGLDHVKLQIQQALEWAMLYPETFQALGLPLTRGVLLYGPPGCGKTTLVQAAATACRVTFLSLSCAQLYSPYVGDSEKKVTETFQKARALAPTILFLDEIDSVVGKRSESSSGVTVSERVLSVLLNEMDGIGVRLDTKMNNKASTQLEVEGESNNSQISNDRQVTRNPNDSHVLVVAATNRPDMLDAALLRPGRMDQLIFVPPPDAQGRLQAFQVHTKQMPLAVDVDLKELAERTPGYTGADVKGVCREAGLLALQDSLNAEKVEQTHFNHALTICKPSLSADLSQVEVAYSITRR